MLGNEHGDEMLWLPLKLRVYVGAGVDGQIRIPSTAFSSFSRDRKCSMLRHQPSSDWLCLMAETFLRTVRPCP